MGPRDVAAQSRLLASDDSGTENHVAWREKVDLVSYGGSSGLGSAKNAGVGLGVGGSCLYSRQRTEVTVADTK